MASYEVRSVGNRRGLFATQAIAAGELIDECPVISFPAAEWDSIKTISMYPNTFLWDRTTDALALGAVTLAKWAPDADSIAHWSANKKNMTLVLRAKDSIEIDQEITVFWTNIGIADRL